MGTTNEQSVAVRKNYNFVPYANVQNISFAALWNYWILTKLRPTSVLKSAEMFMHNCNSFYEAGGSPPRS